MALDVIDVIDPFHRNDVTVITKADMPGIKPDVSLGFHPVIPLVRMKNTIMCLDPSEGLNELIKGLTRDVIHMKVALDAD